MALDIDGGSFEDESYHDDPVDFRPKKSRWRKNQSLAASILILISGAYFFQSTLAANINLNSGKTLEFGQGISQQTACSGTTSLKIVPYANFSNGSGSTGTFYFSSFTVSNIPTTCYGATFSLSAFDSVTASSALSLFDSTVTSADIYDNNGSFMSSSGSSLTVSSISSSSFSATFANPVAIGKNIAKIILQSTNGTIPFNFNSVSFTPSTYLMLSPGVTLGNGAFTIDTYLKTGSSIHGGDILGNSNASNSFSFILDSDIRFHTDGYGVAAHNYTPASNLQPNTWYHITLVRDVSLNTALWIDGTRATTGVLVDNINYSTPSTGINWALCTWCVQGNSTFNGERISNLRVVVGTALFDPNSPTISVPSKPLANVANTKLLLLFSDAGSITVDSSGNQTVTNNGTTFVSGQ